MFVELVPLVPLAGTEWLMQVFDSLNSTRSQGLNGAMAVTFVELKAFCELTDTNLEPWHVEALRGMDAAYLDEAYKLNEE